MKTKDTEYPKIYLYRRVVQAKLFIDENFSEKIDLDKISDEAFFSKFHFVRLFKKIYGKSPHQYLIYVRIEKAKEFLKKNLPVTEVCSLVGFESVSSFTGLFKRIVKKTPSVFQQEEKTKQENIKSEPLSFIPNCFAEAILLRKATADEKK